MFFIKLLSNRIRNIVICFQLLTQSYSSLNCIHIKWHTTIMKYRIVLQQQIFINIQLYMITL